MYNRQFNFSNFQALNPATPLPGVNVDIELSSIKVTLDALNSNLNLIQRSDGQLANQSVGPQQLQPSLLTGISPPTQWTGSGFSYDVGDTVFSGFLFYVCKTANISSTANPPATFNAWTLLADFSGVVIPAGSITSAAFAPGAVNSAALGAGLSLSSSPAPGDDSTAIATTAFVQAQTASILSGFKNRIINGTMAIDQRNGGSSGSSTGYTIDRWRYNSSQSGKGTWQQQSATPPAGFPFYLNMFTAATYTPGTTDNSYLSQTIEANDIYDLQFGTANATALTLTFWVKTLLSGAYGGAIQNAAGTRSYPFLYSGVANSWNLISITIPGDMAGTWVNSGTGGGLTVKFCLGAGATFLGTANAWATGNFTGPTGSSQIIGAAGNGIAITGVSLQAGPGVSEWRPAAQEYLLCQRSFEAATLDIISLNTTSGATYRKYTNFLTRKRVAPTVAFSGITASGFPTSSPSINTADVSGIRWGAVSSATTSGGFLSVSWAADADF